MSLVPAEHKARQAQLIEQHGTPEHIGRQSALVIARVTGVNPDETYAHVYRDEAAADAWLGANWDNYGHPTLARVALPDGRVLGILDLRPALAKEKA
jgi:hypothetical protein